MTTFDGTPFQYNPSVTNVNIDNQLAGILSQFSDDYIIDVVKDSLNSRLRMYSLPMPNVVAAFENSFKQITDGFSSDNGSIMATRNRVYKKIIDTICEYYNFTFNDSESTDYYSAAYWLYDFLVARFTEYLKTFYTLFLIDEREPIDSALELSQIRKDNDSVLAYSRKLFKDPKLANIHCNIEYVISQIGAFNIDLGIILSYVYQSNVNLPMYIRSLVTDSTGTFFRNHYQSYIINSNDSADILTYIKLSLQQLGGDIEPERN